MSMALKAACELCVQYSSEKIVCGLTRRAILAAQSRDHIRSDAIVTCILTREQGLLHLTLFAGSPLNLVLISCMALSTSSGSSLG